MMAAITRLKETVMRALTLIVLATAPLLVAAPACAQTYDPSYPVCLHAYTRHGDHFECTFATMAQCRASAAGRGAQCLINPYYGHALGKPAGVGRRLPRLPG
jgi:hypothetical protein